MDQAPMVPIVEHITDVVENTDLKMVRRMDCVLFMSVQHLSSQGRYYGYYCFTYPY